MLAAKIEATIAKIEKVTEEYNALRQAEINMHTLLGMLYGDIRTKLVEKMELDMTLQSLRQLEWSENHQMRDSSTPGARIPARTVAIDDVANRFCNTTRIT